MYRSLVLFLATFFMISSAYADGGHDHHAVPTLKKQVGSKITYGENTATLTFGPIDAADRRERLIQIESGARTGP